VPQVHELKPNGDQIIVTNENREVSIQLIQHDNDLNEVTALNSGTRLSCCSLTACGKSHSCVCLFIVQLFTIFVSRMEHNCSDCLETCELSLRAIMREYNLSLFTVFVAFV